MPTAHRLRLHDHQGIHDARCKPIEADNSTLCWWRKVKISASSDDLDRNNPMTVHQISLRMSPIGASIARFAAIRQLDRVYASDNRRILVQGKVCSRAVVIGHIRKEEVTQVSFAEDDDMV
jgi:hypothetical protein